jgi:hypothetical protein
VSQQINLFNPIFLKQKKVLGALAMAQALGALLAGALVVTLYARANVATLQQQADSGRAQLAEREKRLARVKAEFAPRARSPALEAQLVQAQSRLQGLREVSGVIERGELGNTNGFAAYFKALARQHQSGVWLTGVTIGAAGNELGMQGRALDAALVPAYLGRLAHEQVMRGKDFASLKISQASAREGSTEPPPQYVEFSLDSSTVEASK